MDAGVATPVKAVFFESQESSWVVTDVLAIGPLDSDGGAYHRRHFEFMMLDQPVLVISVRHLRHH
jgi:hypothetical protein